ncbi:hypothetical protein [Saccharothrix obliqua]|uniref:hypothetical protein n=1 Tax=Saccharothrix obliqua TaxID=2861747 RepID=UPI001C60584D|nr:hypothetical protein [Saccharothrix obliqua]MBW4716210.1 hypothetical protein [Saccharothrix obliqua]
MAKHAYVAYKLTVTKARQADTLLNLGDLEATGIDFLALFHGFLSDVQAKPIKDERFGRYLDIESISPRGRCIRFITQYGRYGTTGRLIDTTTGDTTHDYDEDESAVSPTRNLLASPESGDSAVFLAERYGGRGAASMILGQFKRAFKQRFEDDNLIFNYEGLLDQAAWDKYVQNADMTAIEVTRHGASSDFADGSVAKAVGKIVCAVKPRWGERRFPRTVRDRVLSSEVKAQEVIGLKAQDDDEVELVLNDGVQQKRLLVGQPGVPVLVYPVADDNADRPTDDEVYAAMRQKVSELRTSIGLKLPYAWEAGEWGRQQLGVALAAVRDG